METLELKVEKAAETDRQELIALLSSSDLPSGDLPSSLATFLIIRAEGKIIGSVGIELYETFGLLRSLAVNTDYRNKKLGGLLVHSILELAKDSGANEVFLITTTAKEYFERKGFKTIDREKVPDKIKGTGQFAGICPSTAPVMSRIL